jgi:protein involved in polysaccharide export with SLBB domain
MRRSGSGATAVRRGGHPVLLLCVLWILAALTHAPAAHAQDVEELRRQAERVLGRPISNQEALQMLQQSGLSSDQVRDLLEEKGYSRTAADPYLSVLEGIEKQVPGTATPVPLLEALTESDLASSLAGDSLPSDLMMALQRLDTVQLAEEEELGPLVFGREIFLRTSSQFRPQGGGPVPPDYRVGPEDELILVLTGDVELAYRLLVAREGWVAIPDLGRVDVAGLTLAELRQRLTRRLSTVYSGLTGDANATTFLDLSLGLVHTNTVYVIGEVERPGAYEVSSLATVFAALYAAGGPKRSGSFRQIRVNRGEETRATVDLYDYLLDGRGSGATHLEHGDVVFVPVAQRRVEVDGAIVRPAIYELSEGDDLGDVLDFAGGLTSNASAARVQIARVLPPEQQEPGLNRVLLDVPIAGPDASRDLPLIDGDRITVFAVLEDLRNTVHVTGGVWRPGAYGVEPGLRLWDVIERAGGLLPDAYEGRVQIQRLQDDYTRRMIHVSLERDSSGMPIANPTIEPLDQVFVFASRSLREQRAVSIGGWVRRPGVYPYVEGMTVRDLVLRAGGLRTGAFLGAADIARVSIGQARSDTITRTFSVALDSSLVFDARSAGVADTASSGADFPLLNLDAVYVRKAPGFEPQRRVIVTGEVTFTGPYSVEMRTERIVDLVARAGGMTGEAYAEGLQLWRAETPPEDAMLTGAEIAGQAFGDTALVGVARDRRSEPASSDSLLASGQGGPKARVKVVTRTRVGVDYVEALRDPASSHNVLVEPGDSVFVPRFIPTVDVRGAVQAPTKVLFKEGEGGNYYIERAGGYLPKADKGRARVQLANGEILTRRGKFLFFGGGLPQPDPGSVITVPLKEEKPPGPGTLQVLGVVTGLVTATATIILAATR